MDYPPTVPSTTQTRGRVRVQHGGKRVRAYLGGELVADTTRPLLVWEKPYYPAYYFPAADVRTELLTPDGGVTHSPSRGDADVYTVHAGGQERPGAALRYEHSPFDELRDTVRLDWDAMDAWFEEDEEVFAHARDPTRASTSSPARDTSASSSTASRSPSRPSPAPLRDRPPPPLLPAEDRRAHGPARCRPTRGATAPTRAG